ncbi:MAG: 3-dehydroquinate synthase [Ruminococcaceae bacterium]|nr:3-dehydroquinate synthase [Oscillospiraceae bacterium]
MSVITIPVNTGKPYEIKLGRGLIAHAGELIREVHKGARALVVSDSNVSKLYAKTVSDSLVKAGYRVVSVLTFPAGEKHKTLVTINHIYSALARGQFDRSDVIVALGGGVTGDMAGYAAATWMRGIDFVQIPTSLLAQVDSSIGGKTGVDIPEGKNLVGAFHQPIRVIADIDTLSTLPQEYVTDGMGEVVKSACIRDRELFELLEKDQPFSPALLCEVVRRCMLIKCRVVENDEHEHGERKLLNFGHTLGHALEKHLKYTGISHGCAVAVGMAAITAASERAGLTESGTTKRLCALLRKFGLPTKGPAAVSEYLDAVKLDKKCIGGNVDLVLLSAIGDAFCHRVAVRELEGFVL